MIDEFLKSVFAPGSKADVTEKQACEDKNDCLKTGDVVYLKSNNDILMTVGKVSEGEVECSFFDECKRLNVHTFLTKMLKKVL